MCACGPSLLVAHLVELLYQSKQIKPSQISKSRQVTCWLRISSSSLTSARMSDVLPSP
jgi:hypothetical protein